MRLLVGSDHRVLIPAATLFGGLFLVLSDTLARTVLSPQQLPVGVITALLGVPLFLLLLNRIHNSHFYTMRKLVTKPYQYPLPAYNSN